MEISSSQCLLNRRNRALLIMRSNLLKFRTASLEQSGKSVLEYKQKVQAKYYDRHARDLLMLSECDVRMHQYMKGDPGVINHRLDEDSYEFHIPSGTYRRNRRHLRKSSEPVKNVRNGQPLPTSTDTLSLPHNTAKKKREVHHL